MSSGKAIARTENKIARLKHNTIAFLNNSLYFKGLNKRGNYEIVSNVVNLINKGRMLSNCDPRVAYRYNLLLKLTNNKRPNANIQIENIGQTVYKLNLHAVTVLKTLGFAVHFRNDDNTIAKVVSQPIEVPFKKMDKIYQPKLPVYDTTELVADDDIDDIVLAVKTARKIIINTNCEIELLLNEQKRIEQKLLILQDKKKQAKLDLAMAIDKMDI